MSPSSSRLTTALFIGSALVALVQPSTAVAAGESAVPPMSMAFGSDGVSVTGASPLGPVVWFGVGRVPADFVATVVRTDDVTVADTFGTAILSTPVTWRSMWAAVDLRTGRYVLGAPPGYPLRRVPLPDATSRLTETTISIPGQLTEVLMVRPDFGAWGQQVMENGPGDVLPDPGIQINMSALQSLAATPPWPPPPVVMLAGDVVIIMNPRTMRVAAGHAAELLIGQQGAAQ